jgi:2-(1,2-epoxy-1,2-dihydrophenyl)acetyl-CoA isomerase
MTPAPDGREETVTVTLDGGVGIVTLHRPPHNLLTEDVLHQVADAIHALGGQARAAVLASEGRSFCAGANFRSGDAPDPSVGGGFEAQTRAFYQQAARIYESPLPVVAAIQGAAIGAGFGLALACDIRVVGTSGWFQANFVRLGIHPGFGLSIVLPAVIGPARAAEIFLTGRRVAADEAVAIGLAHRQVESGEEVGAAVRLASEMASGAPLAVAATRATLRRGLGASVRAAMRHELAEQTALAGTADAVEGVSAVLAGRAPVFQGR